jgi:hypothetical protein
LANIEQGATYQELVWGNMHEFGQNDDQLRADISTSVALSLFMKICRQFIAKLNLQII